jgi:dimethylamine/trimethylamine dehydrogenase
MFRQRMHDAGIKMRVGTYLIDMARGRLSGRCEYGDPITFDVDSLVLVTQRLSNDGLYRELTADPAALNAAGIEAVYRIGDCVAPRLLADAVFDGHRLGREIDGPHPDTPLPYLRERMVGSERARAVVAP